MAHRIADRVSETSSTTGTGPFALAGAPAGFIPFSAIPSIATSDTVHYCITMGSDFEVGLGTYSAANQLTRTTVYASSNGGAAVSWAAGTKTVFLTLPAEAIKKLAPMPPIGSAMYAAAAPPGYVAMDGAAYPQTMYPELFALLGKRQDQVLATAPWVARIAQPTMTGNIVDMLFADGVLYAMNNSGVVYRSTDGIQWVAGTASSLTSNAKGMAYGNGRLVVTSTTASAFSTDGGATWTNGGALTVATSAVFAAGLFVAAQFKNGSDYSFYTSPDAVTWTKRGSAASLGSAGTVVLYGNGVFLSSFADGSVFKSTDGITWTATTNCGLNASNPGFPGTGLYGNGKFIIVAAAGYPSGRACATTADDGTTWSVQAASNDGSGINDRSGVYAGGVYHFFGPSKISYSSDGLAWTTNSTEFPAITAGGATAAFGRIFVGQSGATTYSVASSTLPVAASAFWTTWRDGMSNIAYGANVVLATGAHGSLMRSGNVGMSWTEEPRIPTTTLASWLGYLNGQFIGFATGNTAPYYSADGSTWTAAGGAPGVASVSAATYGFGLYVIGSTGGALRTSPDLTTWTGRTSALSNAINGIAFNGTVMVAVANASGQISSSTNGTAWTLRSPPASGYASAVFNDVAWGAGLFVAVTAAGQVATSPDGTTWTNRTNASSGAAINAVSFGGGLFVAVGAGGLIMNSADGINWTARTSPYTAGAWTDVVWTDNCFVIVGPEHRVVTAWPYTYDANTEFKVLTGTGADVDSTSTLELFLKAA